MPVGINGSNALPLLLRALRSYNNPTFYIERET